MGLAFGQLLTRSLPLLLGYVLPGMAGAAPPPDVVSAPAPVLVELFTSEGCSSCPPADTLLREIEGTRTGSGALVVGISEHVTYWNRLGWSDPYSSPTFTARQEAYRARFHQDDVYTPQMVVNGSHQFVGSDRRALQSALQGGRGVAAEVTLHILSTEIVGGRLSIRFSAGAVSNGKRADVVAVLADDLDQSGVTRGENAGRTLTHVSVARLFTRVAGVRAAGQWTVDLPLPASFQAVKGKHHLILFAQGEDLGPVMGADTKPI